MANPWRYLRPSQMPFDSGQPWDEPPAPPQPPPVGPVFVPDVTLDPSQVIDVRGYQAFGWTYDPERGVFIDDTFGTVARPVPDPRRPGHYMPDVPAYPPISVEPWAARNPGPSATPGPGPARRSREPRLP